MASFASLLAQRGWRHPNETVLLSQAPLLSDLHLRHMATPILVPDLDPESHDRDTAFDDTEELGLILFEAAASV